MKLFPRHRAVHVDPQLGVTLDNGRLMEADVILGADGLFVGDDLPCNPRYADGAAVDDETRN